MWRPPPPTNAHMHMHIHTRTQAAMSMRLLPKIIIMIHKAVALLPGTLFSFPSLSVHTARNKMRPESRGTSTLHKIKGSIINTTFLVFYCFVTQIKNSNLELSDVACRLSNEVTAERMNTNYNRVILDHFQSFSHTELKQTAN